MPKIPVLIAHAETATTAKLENTQQTTDDEKNDGTSNYNLRFRFFRWRDDETSLL